VPPPSLAGQRASEDRRVRVPRAHGHRPPHIAVHLPEQAHARPSACASSRANQRRSWRGGEGPRSTNRRQWRRAVSACTGPAAEAAHGGSPRAEQGARRMLRLEPPESTQMGVGEGRRDRAPPALCSAASSAAGDCTSLSGPCWSTHANGGLTPPALPALQLSQRCPTGTTDGAAATLWGGGRGGG